MPTPPTTTPDETDEPAADPAPVPAAPAPTPPPPEAARPEATPIALDTFLGTTFGRKLDQAAGFVHHVSKLKPPPRRLVRAEWQKLLDTFQKKPIG